MRWRRRLAAAVTRRIRGPYQSLGRLDALLYDVQDRLGRIEQALAALEGTQDAVTATRDAVTEARDAVGKTRDAVTETRDAVAATRDAVAETRGAVGGVLEIGGETRAYARATHDLATGTNELLHGEIRTAMRAVASEEASNRRRLHALREAEEYALAWTEPRPLITVTVATLGRPEMLATRSLPSILAQTYTELELIVVGDHADEATAEAVRALVDPRLTYRNLTQRLHFTDDPYHQWLVGATMARNEANRLAKGRWLVCFDDDDVMRPDCLERLLERAVEGRFEAVYGRALSHLEDEDDVLIGSFPPALGQFTWAAGLYHAGLRFLERELFAADLGLPGDWFLAERMLRAGVRFEMLDAVLCDLYPSRPHLVSPAGDTRDLGASSS